MTNVDDSSPTGPEARGEATPLPQGAQVAGTNGVEQLDSEGPGAFGLVTAHGDPAAGGDFDEAGLFGPQDDIFRRKVIREVSPRRGPATHLDQVRARLALGILVGLFILYLLLFWAAIWGGMDMQMVQILATILSGPQALAAAAVGFYYATKDRQAKKSTP